jgi:hypothetical protein
MFAILVRLQRPTISLRKVVETAKPKNAPVSEIKYRYRECRRHIPVPDCGLRVVCVEDHSRTQS